MNLNSQQQADLKHYLLGRLPESELDTIDERLVTDGDFYEEVLIAEDELIDQYLNKELNESEKESFEKFFLIAPERRAKLQFSDSFQTYLKSGVAASEPETDIVAVSEDREKVIDHPPESNGWYYKFLPVSNPAVAYALMAIVLIMVLGGLWVMLKKNQGPEPNGLYAVVLKSGGERTIGTANKFSVPSGTGTVELKPELQGDPYPSYEAVITDAEKSEIARANKLQPTNESGTRMLKWDVPARLLPPGDYLLHVSGVDAAGKVEKLPAYPFRVAR